MALSALDLAVVAVYLVATATIGSWLGRGQRTTADYFLGNRNLPWWLVCFSIIATETSTLTFIGAPAIAYAGNLTFLQVAVGYLFGRILVSWVLLPGYFRGEIQSAYEVLQERFGSRVRRLSALVFQVSRLLADGVRLFSTALVLSVVTGMSDLSTIAIIAAFTLIYTFLGGIRAVVWNDAVQLVIYVAGALLAGWVLLDRIPGGWETVWRVGSEAGKFQVLNFDWDLSQAYTFWAGLLGGAFLTFATHGTDQMMVQRYLACGSQRRSRAALITSGVLVIVQFLLFLMLGVLLYVFYTRFPLQETLTQPDRIFPIFIVNELPAGVSGLVLAAVFAAAMSTLSSSLNSLASSSVADFYRPFFAPGRTEKHYLWASRLWTLAWALALFLVALLARTQTSVLEAGLSITSFTMGSLLGVFLLGTFSAVDQRSALAGMVGGLLVMAIVVGWTPLAWPWFVLAGTVVSVGIGLMVEAVSPRTAKQT